LATFVSPTRSTVVRYAKQLSVGITFSAVEQKMLERKLPARFVDRLKRALGREQLGSRASVSEGTAAAMETVSSLCADQASPLQG